MITFEEAYRIVLDNSRDFGVTEVPLLDSVGRVLRENWVADRDFPPFDRVMMDGIAIMYNQSVGKGGRFVIEDVAAAGNPQKQLSDPKQCLEVMTGAILPLQTDTVIRYEDIEIKDGSATLMVDVKKGQNIHKQGMDIGRGDLLLKSDKTISTADIGIGASIGKSKVKVSKLPSTLIVSTGDELVSINQSPQNHQIRMSNVYQIATVLEDCFGIESEMIHLSDDKQNIKENLEKELSEKDLIILSGGVSKGKFDYIPEVLGSLGVEKLFHRVKQRPGKPFWFGTHPNGCTVFALPGNPISSYMCIQVYLKDWLSRSLKAEEHSLKYAKLAEDFTFNPDLTYFLETRLEINEKTELLAWPQKGNGSGDLANLSRAHAFIRLPKDENHFKKGDLFPIHQFAPL